MKFRVKNAPQFKAALGRKIESLSSRDVLLYVGQTARRLIITRTRSGKNEDGRAFRPYSVRPVYVSLKDRPVPRGGIKTPQTKRKAGLYTRRTGTAREVGRTTKRGGKSMFFPGGYREYKSNLYGAGVNLTKTGLMLRAVRAVVRRKAVRVGVYDGDVLDRAHGTHEDRRWFGIGNLPSERKALQEAWREAVRRNVK